MNHDHQDDHDRGLAYDLKVISSQMIARRRALAWFATAGAGALVAGCGGGSDSSSSSDTTASTTTTSTTGSTTTGTTTTGTTTTTTSTSSGTCIADPQETSGPYPADGTNTASGSTSNVLTQSGIVRSDIRSSFISSTTTAAGILVKITMTVVNSNSSCAPLAGYAVYFWQCDAAGHYSLYTAATESYLRGVQVTDANGQVTFTTIFPACYDGRWPHMHFEIYTSLSAATSGRNATLTSQFCMPQALARAIYTANSSTYTSSTANFAKVSLSTDLVFGDNTTAQNTQMTPTFTGSDSAGYTATATVGIAV